MLSSDIQQFAYDNGLEWLSEQSQTELFQFGSSARINSLVNLRLRLQTELWRHPVYQLSLPKAISRDQIDLASLKSIDCAVDRLLSSYPKLSLTPLPVHFCDAYVDSEAPFNKQFFEARQVVNILNIIIDRSDVSALIGAYSALQKWYQSEFWSQLLGVERLVLMAESISLPLSCEQFCVHHEVNEDLLLSSGYQLADALFNFAVSVYDGGFHH